MTNIKQHEALVESCMNEILIFYYLVFKYIRNN